MDKDEKFMKRAGKIFLFFLAFASISVILSAEQPISWFIALGIIWGMSYLVYRHRNKIKEIATRWNDWEPPHVAQTRPRTTKVEKISGQKQAEQLTLDEESYLEYLEQTSFREEFELVISFHPPKWWLNRKKGERKTPPKEEPYRL